MRGVKMKKNIRVAVGIPVNKKDSFGRQYIMYKGRESVYVENKLESLIEDLKRIQKVYGKDYTNLELQTERDCGCYSDCGCSPSYVVYGNRLESDVEYADRIEREEKYNKASEEKERADYEKLKKKYETLAKDVESSKDKKKSGK
jgi:hypothetical protein